MEKVCTACLVPKPLDDFGLHPRGKFGRKSQCKFCVSKKAQQRRLENPEQDKAIKRRFRAKHRERLLKEEQARHHKNREKERVQKKEWWRTLTQEQRERRRQRRRELYAQNPQAQEKNQKTSKAWREKYPERVKAFNVAYHEKYHDKLRNQKREWRRKNRTMVRAAYKRYVERHRDVRRKAARRRYANNPEKFRVYARMWNKLHPEHGYNSALRRRTRMAGLNVIERFTHLEIAIRDGWRCHICGKRVSRKNWSFDHLIPVVHHGPHARINVALAHVRCNSKMGVARLPAQLRLLP
jgi:hypothetical protein